MMMIILRYGYTALVAGLLLTGFCYAQEGYSDPEAAPLEEKAVMYLSNDDLPKNGHHYYMIPPESPAPAAANPSAVAPVPTPGNPAAVPTPAAPSNPPAVPPAPALGNPAAVPTPPPQ